MRFALIAVSIFSALTFTAGSRAFANEYGLPTSIEDFDAATQRLQCDQINRCMNELKSFGQVRGLEVTITVQTRSQKDGSSSPITVGQFSDGRICDCANPSDIQCR